MIKAKEILTKDQVKSVEKAIKEAENNTSAEIVPIICNKSGEYDQAQCLFGVIFSLLVLAITWLNFQSINIDNWGTENLAMDLGYVLAAILVSFIVGTVLASYFWILNLPFIPKQKMLQETEKLAKQCFYDYSIGNTSGSTGVLIFISIFERLVLVKGDSNINSKLTQKDWDKACQLIVTGIKNKKIDKGLIDSIQLIGTSLKEHFPRQKNDINELPNKVHFID